MYATGIITAGIQVAIWIASTGKARVINVTTHVNVTAAVDIFMCRCGYYSGSITVSTRCIRIGICQTVNKHRRDECVT